MRHRWTNFSRGLWLVGPPETNPPQSLRRAKGAAPLRSLALRSRSGTLSFFALPAHSMTRYNDEYVIGHGTSLSKSVSRAIGSEVAITGSAVFDSTALTFVQMPPTTVGLGTVGVADYLFVAGGGDLKKVDPLFNSAANPVTEWGIDPPDISNASATLVTQTSAHADNLDAIGDGTVWVEGDGSDDFELQNDTTRFIEGTGSMRFLGVAKDTTVDARRTGISEDWSNIGGGVGSSPLEDYVQFAIRINRPKRLKAVSIMFDVDSPPVLLFNGKSFSRELKVRVVRKRRRRKLIGTGDIIRRKDERKFIKGKKDLPRDRSTQEFLTEDTIGVVRRKWTRVTIPKSTFDIGGNADPDSDWANVRGIRIEVETNKQGRVNVNFDDLKLVGGVGMQGDYQYNVTYKNSTTGTRSNPDLSNTITIKDIERQAVTLEDIPFSSDPQVDKVEIWRTLGNGEIFFKEQEQDNTDAGGGVIADFTSNVADYIGMFEGAANSLDPDLELPLDNTKPDDTFEDAVGPHVGRMWWARDTAAGKKGRVYYSPIGRAEAVDGFIDLASDEDETQKLVRWNEQLWCFTKRGLLRIVGNTEPFVFHEVWGAPGTDQPFSVVPSPEGILYLAKDGVRLFTGNESVLLAADDPLAPLFRGSTTDGFAVTFNGSAAAYGRSEYYLSDATDSTRTTLAVNTRTGAWRELGFPSKFLFYDQKANILFGRNIPATVGGVWHTRLTTAGNSFNVTTVATYLMIGTASSPAVGKAAVDDAQFLLPRDVTVTAIYVRLGSALTGSQTLDCNLNIDGSKDTTFTVTHDSTTGTLTSNTGSIAVNQDQLLALEFTFGGGLTTAAINSVVVVYEIIPE
jgi:hypothetical protein